MWHIDRPVQEEGPVSVLVDELFALFHHQVPEELAVVPDFLAVAPQIVSIGR